MKTKSTNYIHLEFLSRSANEAFARGAAACFAAQRSEEHTSELQSQR